MPLEGQVALEQRIVELERIAQITQVINSTLDLNELLDLIIITAADLVGTEGGSILLADRRTGELFFAAATGAGKEELKKIKVPVEGSIAGTVFKTRQPLIVQDVDVDPRHYDEVDQDIQFDTRSILAVPLIFKDRAVGVLEAVNKKDGVGFVEHDVSILSNLASQAAVAIENARLVGELKETYAQLAELDRVKSDFLAIASHELRTPLGVILGFAGFLREEADEDAREQLDAVLNAATQLRGLIDDMMNLTYLETGAAELELVEFNLQSLVIQVVNKLCPLAEAKNQHVRQNLPETNLYVKADQAKISMVLTNLLSNAIKFTPPGGRIEVMVRPQTGMVAVSVADTGRGIPADKLERIFDRFYQVDSHMTRQHEGMGLGLSIAKGMVELHGGRIWAESVEGQGSRFTFTLPILWKDAVPRENPKA